MDLRGRGNLLPPSPQRCNHDKRFLWDTLPLKRLFSPRYGHATRPFF